jgi:hypothetical protein
VKKDKINKTLLFELTLDGGEIIITQHVEWMHKDVVLSLEHNHASTN